MKDRLSTAHAQPVARPSGLPSALFAVRLDIERLRAWVYVCTLERLSEQRGETQARAAPAVVQWAVGVDAGRPVSLGAGSVLALQRTPVTLPLPPYWATFQRCPWGWPDDPKQRPCDQPQRMTRWSARLRAASRAVRKLLSAKTMRWPNRPRRGPRCVPRSFCLDPGSGREGDASAP
jgi:hypothetical protein